MIFKKYHLFLEYNNQFGVWVESLIEDDFIKELVNRYIGGMSSDLSVKNSINVLSNIQKEELNTQIQDYLKNGLKTKEVTVSASSPGLSAGDYKKSERSLLSTFLRALVAMGSEVKRTTDGLKEDFLFLYETEAIDKYEIEDVFSRFKSLSEYTDNIDFSHNNIKFYIGLYVDGSVGYGMVLEDRMPIGNIVMNNTNIKWLNSQDIKSLGSFTAELTELKYKKLMMICKTVTDLKNYRPSNFTGEPVVDYSMGEAYLSFKGLGIWDSGILTNESIQIIKNDFREWSKNKKWRDDVLFKVSPEDLSVKIIIKFK